MGIRSIIRDRRAAKSPGYWPALAAELDREGEATPASIAPVGHRTAQTLYGPDGRRCAAPGCGAPSVTEICVACTAAGRLPDGSDGYVPPDLDRVLPDPYLDHPGDGFIPEMIAHDADLVLDRALARLEADDELEQLLIKAFSCTVCGGRLADDMSCDDYGAAHVQDLDRLVAEGIETRPGWQDR